MSVAAPVLLSGHQGTPRRSPPRGLGGAGLASVVVGAGNGPYPVAPGWFKGVGLYDMLRNYVVNNVTDSLADAYANTTNGVSDHVGAAHPGHAAVVGDVRPGIRTGVAVGRRWMTLGSGVPGLAASHPGYPVPARSRFRSRQTDRRSTDHRSLAAPPITNDGTYGRLSAQPRLPRHENFPPKLLRRGVGRYGNSPTSSRPSTAPNSTRGPARTAATSPQRGA